VRVRVRVRVGARMVRVRVRVTRAMIWLMRPPPWFGSTSLSQGRPSEAGKYCSFRRALDEG